MFVGCGTALVTPFTRDGQLDEMAFRRLVERQIEAGINFLVPCGTTGESPTLTRREHLRVVELTVEEAQGRVPVLAGAGGYNTAEVVELALEIEALGANGLLSVTPYYNKPTPEGLFLHYQAIAAATRLPIIVYSIQGRTGIGGAAGRHRPGPPRRRSRRCRGVARSRAGGAPPRGSRARRLRRSRRTPA